MKCFVFAALANTKHRIALSNLDHDLLWQETAMPVGELSVPECSLVEIVCGKMQASKADELPSEDHIWDIFADIAQVRCSVVQLRHMEPP